MLRITSMVPRTLGPRHPTPRLKDLLRRNSILQPLGEPSRIRHSVRGGPPPEGVPRGLRRRCLEEERLRRWFSRLERIHTLPQSTSHLLTQVQLSSLIHPWSVTPCQHNVQFQVETSRAFPSSRSTVPTSFLHSSSPPSPFRFNLLFKFSRLTRSNLPFCAVLISICCSFVQLNLHMYSTQHTAYVYLPYLPSSAVHS